MNKFKSKNRKNYIFNKIGGVNMEKSKMLLIALGQGAGNIVDGLLSKNKRYNGLFFNSSLFDIKPLKMLLWIKMCIYIQVQMDQVVIALDQGK